MTSRTTTMPWLCTHTHALPLSLTLQCTHFMHATKQLTWEQGCTLHRGEWSVIREDSRVSGVWPPQKMTKADTWQKQRTGRSEWDSNNAQTAAQWIKRQEMSPMQQWSSSLSGSELQQVKAYNGWTVETSSCKLPSSSLTRWSDCSGQYFLTCRHRIFFTF